MIRSLGSMLLGSLFLAGMVSDSAGQPASAAWPVFRGNLQETGIAPAPLPDNLTIRWKFQAKDSVEATAVIAGDTVYVGSLDENLYALDLHTGQEKWHVKAGPVKVAAAVRDGLIYVGNLDGIFSCLDAATGKLHWKIDTENEITSGPSFAGDNILFGCGDESLYCLSKDGKNLWQFKVAGGPVLATPAMAGDRTFVSGCDSSLHVLDVKTGKQTIDPIDLDGQTGATPAIFGDTLYVGTMSNQVLAVDWKKGTVTWRFEAPKRQQPFFSSPAVTDKLVIAGSRDKRVYAIDRKTGKEVWNYLTKGKVDSSPVVAGKRVYVGSFDGWLYVLDLEQGTEVAKFQLSKKAPVAASPAVAGQWLVIGTDDGMVYGFGPKP